MLQECRGSALKHVCPGFVLVWSLWSRQRDPLVASSISIIFLSFFPFPRMINAIAFSGLKLIRRPCNWLRVSLLLFMTFNSFSTDCRGGSSWTTGKLSYQGNFCMKQLSIGFQKMFQILRWEENASLTSLTCNLYRALCTEELLRFFSGPIWDWGHCSLIPKNNIENALSCVPRSQRGKHISHKKADFIGRRSL